MPFSQHDKWVGDLFESIVKDEMSGLDLHQNTPSIFPVYVHDNPLMKDKKADAEIAHQFID